jgi:hypothetical protein
MKRVEVTQATGSLEQYTRELGEEPLVLTEGGHAIAALLPIGDADVESLTLSQNPRFQELINQARAEYRSGASVSAEEARRELGIHGPEQEQG